MSLEALGDWWCFLIHVTSLETRRSNKKKGEQSRCILPLQPSKVKFCSIGFPGTSGGLNRLHSPSLPPDCWEDTFAGLEEPVGIHRTFPFSFPLPPRTKETKKVWNVISTETSERKFSTRNWPDVFELAGVTKDETARLSAEAGTESISPKFCATRSATVQGATPSFSKLDFEWFSISLNLTRPKMFSAQPPPNSSNSLLS